MPEPVADPEFPGLVGVGRLTPVVAGQEATPQSARVYGAVWRFYRHAHGLPVAGAVMTASEVNRAVEWWNLRQEAQGG